MNGSKRTISRILAFVMLVSAMFTNVITANADVNDVSLIDSVVSSAAAVVDEIVDDGAEDLAEATGDVLPENIVTVGESLATGMYCDDQVKIVDIGTDNVTDDGSWDVSKQESLDTIETPDGTVTYNYFVQGTNNPKDSTGKKSYNKQGSPVIPAQGAYIIVTPKADSVLTMDLKINGGTKSYAFMQVDGETATEIEFVQSGKDPIYVRKEYPVSAGCTYYVTGAGSKFGLYGLQLVAASTETSSEPTTAAPTTTTVAEDKPVEPTTAATPSEGKSIDDIIAGYDNVADIKAYAADEEIFPGLKALIALPVVTAGDKAENGFTGTDGVYSYSKATEAANCIGSSDINGDAISFTAPANGKFAIAFKVNGGKSGTVFGESVSASNVGADGKAISEYLFREYDVEAGKTYTAGLGGSKIRIYVMAFKADKAEETQATTKAETTAEPTTAAVETQDTTKAEETQATTKTETPAETSTAAQGGGTDKPVETTTEAAPSGSSGSWNFRSGSDSMEANGKKIEGASGEVNGLLIDATAAGAKWDSTRDDWAQVNTGTKVSIPVPGPCKITVETYSPNVSVKMDGKDYKSATVHEDDGYDHNYVNYVYKPIVKAIAAQEYVVLEMGANDYIGNIIVTEGEFEEIPPVTEEPTDDKPIWGNVNDDTVLDAIDVKLVHSYVLSPSYIGSADTFMAERADVDGNGEINTADVAIILQKVLDSTYRMPVEGEAPPEPPAEAPFTWTPSAVVADGDVLLDDDDVKITANQAMDFFESAADRPDGVTFANGVTANAYTKTSSLNTTVTFPDGTSTKYRIANTIEAKQDVNVTIAAYFGSEKDIAFIKNLEYTADDKSTATGELAKTEKVVNGVLFSIDLKAGEKVSFGGAGTNPEIYGVNVVALKTSADADSYTFWLDDYATEADADGVRTITGSKDGMEITEKGSTLKLVKSMDNVDYDNNAKPAFHSIDFTQVGADRAAGVYKAGQRPANSGSITAIPDAGSAILFTPGADGIINVYYTMTGGKKWSLYDFVGDSVNKKIDFSDGDSTFPPYKATAKVVGGHQYLITANGTNDFAVGGIDFVIDKPVTVPITWGQESEFKAGDLDEINVTFVDAGTGEEQTTVPYGVASVELMDGHIYNILTSDAGVGAGFGIAADALADSFTVKGTEGMSIFMTVVPDVTLTGKIVGDKADDYKAVTALKFSTIRGVAREYAATINADGTYTVTLKPGEYKTSITAEGYSTIDRASVKIEGENVNDVYIVSTTPVVYPTEFKAQLTVPGDYATLTEAVAAIKAMTRPEGEAGRVTIKLAADIQEQVVFDAPYITVDGSKPDGGKYEINWYYGQSGKYYSVGEGGLYDHQLFMDKYEKTEASGSLWGGVAIIRGDYFRTVNTIYRNTFNYEVTDKEIEDGCESVGVGLRTKDSNVQAYTAKERSNAFYIEASSIELDNCEVLSSQDAFGRNGTPKSPCSVYVKNSVIGGNTDYICGEFKALFDNCELQWFTYANDATHNAAVGYIVAPKTDPYVFRNCEITTRGAEGTDPVVGLYGRTWGSGSKTYFVNCETNGHISNDGWGKMNATDVDFVFAEYGNTNGGQPFVTSGSLVPDPEVKDAATIANLTTDNVITAYLGNWRPAFYEGVKDPNEPEVKPTVWVVGDSTGCHYADTADMDLYYKRVGFGDKISDYIYADVHNLALSGRSSKSYIQDPEYKTLKEGMKKGDYIIIAFGHNDEKVDDPDRGTYPSTAAAPTTKDTAGSFKNSLYVNYIKPAQDMDVTPILVTPIVRRPTADGVWSDSKLHITNGGSYTQDVIDLAKDLGITCVDATSLTKNVYDNVLHLGTEAHVDSDGNMVEPTGATALHATGQNGAPDDTHINNYGAKYVAYLIAEALKASDCELGKYVKNGNIAPTTADLVKNPAWTAPEAEDLTGDALISRLWKTKAPWYGSAFGSTGGSPEKMDGTVPYDPPQASEYYEITENGDGTVKVRCGDPVKGTSKGKIATTKEDAFVMYYQPIDATGNYEIKGTVVVDGYSVNDQVAFGAIISDNMKVDQNIKETYTYVAAGPFLLASAGADIKDDSGQPTGAKNQGVMSFGRMDGETLSVGHKCTDAPVPVGHELEISVKKIGNQFTTSVRDITAGTPAETDTYTCDMKGTAYAGFFATRCAAITVKDIVANNEVVE